MRSKSNFGRGRGGNPSASTESADLNPADLISLARKRALASLGCSDRTCESLRRRLTDWGYPEEIVSQVLEELQTSGWLSDERYAQNRVQAGVRRGWGPRRLQQDLQGQGVDSALATASLEELTVDWNEQAEKLANQALGRGKSRDQVARWLAGRGFGSEAIRRALCADRREPGEPN